MSDSPTTERVEDDIRDTRIYSSAGLKCRSATKATLVVGGCIEVEQNLRKSRVCSSGTVTVAGSITGGKVSGYRGIRCAIAGSESGVRTVLAVGRDLYFAAVFEYRRESIDRDLALAAKTKAKSAPLMAKLKTLSPAEKESATVAFYEADQLLQSASKAKAALRALYAKSVVKTAAEIEVTDTLHAGVTVHFGRFRTTIASTYRGGVKLSLERRDELAFVIVTTADGATTELPTLATPAAPTPFAEFFADASSLQAA